MRRPGLGTAERHGGSAPEGVRARAIANNDMVYLFWQEDAKIENCLGFSIHRIDAASGAESPLPTWVGFRAAADGRREVRDSDVWPVQKFQWKDVTAPRGGKYRYRIIPRIGTPGDLRASDDPRLVLETDEVSLDPGSGPIKVYFNRGIISTQAISGALPKDDEGRPVKAALQDHIATPGDRVRNRLKGQIDVPLLELVKRAESQGGECYCALYEFSDEELVAALVESGRVHVVLSNAGDDDDRNASGRRRLREADRDLVDRMLGSGHIGHNKFMVYVDRRGVPTAVMTGSTNWTPTGLCAQTNNALLVESEDLARQYLAYWEALKEDSLPEAEQAAAFRRKNASKGRAIRLAGGQGSVQAWFSPNTEQRTKPRDPETPVDLGEVFERISGAKRGVLFLAFIPGTPSIVTHLRDVYGERVREGGGLFVRGAATDRSTIEGFTVNLFHRSMTSDARVTSVAGIDDQFSFWQKELYKLGHAVIHDKIVVIDPFEDDCTVITGSHNLGFKASYANDENLLIIRGNRPVAAAYAAHVLDVYDHFRWRYRLQEAKADGRPRSAWQALEATDAWQDKYFSGNRSRPSLERRFWTSVA